MPARQTQFPFKYRTFDREVHTFYAPDRASADRYAARWARRMGHELIVRLRTKPSKPV